MILESAALTALLPVVIDAVRAGANKLFGGAGAKPANVAEVIQLMQADTARLQAIAALEGQGQTYQWVEAVRKLQRPVVVLAVVVAYVAGSQAPELPQLVATVGFYLFGDRTYIALKKAVST